MKVLDYGAERKWQGLSALSVPLLPKPLLRHLCQPHRVGLKPSRLVASVPFNETSNVFDG